jgi:aminocarboxymuconate-semialdehyde decarboxylase
MSILLARLVRAWHAFPKAKETLPESPAVTARRFYYDHLVFDPANVRHVIQTFGASQIMVGSDYPFTMGDPEPVKTLQAVGLDAPTLAAISSGNAKRFLAL